MYMAAAINVTQRLMPTVAALRDAIAAKAIAWENIVKIGRTHMQDATPVTLGQEWSGYEGMLTDNLDRLGDALIALFANTARLRAMARAAGDTVERRAGAVERSMRALAPLLPAPAP